MNLPVFQTLEELRSGLRLSGIEGKETDAHAILSNAIGIAKARLASYLGVPRVVELAAMTPDPAGLSEGGILRSLAAIQEGRLVRIEILKTLPVMLLDTSPAARSAWNQESILKTPDLWTLIEDLEREVFGNWSLLAGSEVLGVPVPAYRSAVIGRLKGSPPYTAGDSLLPFWPYISSEPPV